jgi:hypothetical protein
MHVQKTFSANLTLDPLNGDPELVGREIRNHLQQAGVRERQCVVCIPLNWALTLQTPLPEMPEEDVESYLAIEAERGFPYGPEALLVATSVYGAGDKERQATSSASPKATCNNSRRCCDPRSSVRSALLWASPCCSPRMSISREAPLPDSWRRDHRFASDLRRWYCGAAFH